MRAEAFLLAVICALVIAALIFWQRRGQPQKRARRLKVGADGEIIAIGEVQSQQLFQFQGKGTATTRAVDLDAGTYKLLYTFPEDTRVKVDIISATDGENEMLLYKSGVGVKGFSVEQGGRYFFQVEPASKDIYWEMECQMLGLPSRSVAHQDEHL